MRAHKNSVYKRKKKIITDQEKYMKQNYGVCARVPASKLILRVKKGHHFASVMLYVFIMRLLSGILVIKKKLKRWSEYIKIRAGRCCEDPESYLNFS